MTSDWRVRRTGLVKNPDEPVDGRGFVLAGIDERASAVNLVSFGAADDEAV